MRRGAAGKSTLIRSILGYDFAELHSTVGVEARMYEVQQHRIDGGGADWATYDPAESRVLDEAQARMVAEALRGGTAGLGAPQRSIVDMRAAGGGGEAAQGGDEFLGAQMAAADTLRGAGDAQPERVASGARGRQAHASESPVVPRAPPVAAAPESQAAAATDRAPAAAAQ
jgi:hypothetical protein